MTATESDTDTDTARTPRDPAALRAIDVDLHHRTSDWTAIAAYAPEGLRHRFGTRKTGGPPMARHGFKKVGVTNDLVSLPPDGGDPAADPAWVKERYLDARGVDIAVLTGTLFSLGVQPNADVPAAVASAVNDWTLATWVRPFDCYKGSILVSQNDPGAAAAEIDRLGNDPGMVQVLMGSASESPLGRRVYHPIYEACVRHGLPLALHIGGEGAGMSPPATAVGHPSTYIEWYASLPQVYMAHIVSMVAEGVFERFPTLKVVLYEGGVLWVPHLMWRFDKNWKAQRSETPWVTRPPSEYITKHFYHATYPLEATREPGDIGATLEMIGGDRTLLFSGNYPDWELGDPFAMLDAVPGSLRRRVTVENALALYGERLLMSSNGERRAASGERNAGANTGEG